MLEKGKGIDILSELGGVTNYESATQLFENRLDKENLTRIKRIQNKQVVLTMANALAMFEPDSIFINTYLIKP